MNADTRIKTYRTAFPARYNDSLIATEFDPSPALPASREGVAEFGIITFAPGERPLGDIVAAITESGEEARIDIANGLRHRGGRRPVPADFVDLF